MSQNPEIIAAPFTIWIAPVGTAFPAVDVAPGEAWTLLGKHGARSATSEGVVFVHDRQWASSTPAAETGESIAFIERESLKVQLSVFDLTLEQFQLILGQNAIISTAAGPTTPGTASIGLALKAGAASELSVMMRGPSPYDEALSAQYELPRCCETGSPRVRYTRGKASELAVELRALIDPAATSAETRFGRLVAVTAAAAAGPDGTYVLGDTLYGPNIGPRGPKKIIIAPWNQGDIGYCYSTNSLAENLPAWWASNGINTFKNGHPDITLEGRGTQLLAAVKAAGLMLIAYPKWQDRYPYRADFNAMDFRSLAMTDPYWRTKWFSYMVADEMDIDQYPLSRHMQDAVDAKLGEVTKPFSANFTRRIAIPSSSLGSGTINFYEAFNSPQLTSLGLDSYEAHLAVTDAPSATVTRTQPEIWVSPWHNENQPGWPRFTASVTGLAVHMMRNGPTSPGRSDSGAMPVQYPPIAFNTPSYTTYGLVIPPQPMTYAPGAKATHHYVCTSRLDISGAYPRGGQWMRGRYLRSEGWSGFDEGSSSLYIFPQTVGSVIFAGYVDAATNRLTVTSTIRDMIGGAMRVIDTGGNEVGWITRDNPQISGTPRGAGVYALDPAKRTPVNTGSAGTPVLLGVATAAGATGDDSNPENLAELATLIANLERMQAHPTGGDLMIDRVNGGRRAFEVSRCPEIDADCSLYKDDMTRAPQVVGYTLGGVPILNAAGKPPLWDFGWPMGFVAFHVVGDDGAVYSYVRSTSNSDRPTFFPGFAARGLPPRVFGPLELVGFRRVGVAAATEMTGTSAVLKAGVDDGAATWFFIESSAIVQNEGNSGTTAYTITVRRGGDLSGSNTVNVATSGTGIAPASASDFSGGVFPSGTLTFTAGVATQTFTANVIGDTAAEFDETFKFTLSSPSGGAVLVGSGRNELICTITNDDAALSASFVWLQQSGSGAPSVSGAPAGATYLNVTETSFVTRAGIKMRAIGAGFTNNSSVFGIPLWGLDNAIAKGVEFELAAGSWEIAFLAITDGGSGGLLSVIDDPAGAATTRYSYNIPTVAPVRVVDTDGTTYTSTGTAATDAINNLTFTSPITVTDLGGGVGRLRFNGAAPYVLISAIALRRA